MRVAVVGGSGMIGRPLVGRAGLARQRAVVLSRAEAAQRRVDVASGEGPAPALEAVEEGWSTRPTRCGEWGDESQRSLKPPDKRRYVDRVIWASPAAAAVTATPSHRPSSSSGSRNSMSG